MLFLLISFKTTVTPTEKLTTKNPDHALRHTEKKIRSAFSER